MPVFAFGQSATYSWVKLGPPFLPQWLAQRTAKAIGFLPLLMYGVWGSPLPHPVRSPPTREATDSSCYTAPTVDKSG